jgi:uncharacterized repeat protein (TIGR03803 family)
MARAQAIARGTSLPYKVLHRFKPQSSDGYWPVAPLIDVNGTLYGTTEQGGVSDSGTVYSVRRSGVEHVLHSFTGGSDGYSPEAGLTDVNGTLYGTTAGGGSYKHGTVFSISTSGAEQVLYSFAGGSDGSNPEAGLTYANGLLYGTTYEGGGSCGSACGTVFSVSTSGKETVLYRFAGGSSDGAYPQSALIEMNGIFYGTTVYGGYDYTYHCSCGTVYSISKSGREKMLVRFAGADIGAWPRTSLVDVGGTLYGTASGVGSMAAGAPTAYSITPQGEAHDVYAFGSSNIGPSSLIAINGTLYGAMMEGGIRNRSCNGQGCGMIYSLTTSGEFQVLHDFTGSRDGQDPDAALLDVNGTLYGTTVCSLHKCPVRETGVGTVFSLTL